MGKRATVQIRTCKCETCRLPFRMETGEALRHVFKTQSGEHLVLCHCCMEVARLHERAWKALRGPADRDAAEAA